MKKKFAKCVFIGILIAVIGLLIFACIKVVPTWLQSDEVEQDLYEEFLSGNIVATGHYEDGVEFSIAASDLEIGGDDWDAYEVYGYLDVDNDGKDELVLKGPYGGYILDATKDQLNVFVNGGGTGNTLLLAYYEDAYWICYLYAGADSCVYSMYKYEGADKLVDTFYFGWETEESGALIYYRANKDQDKIIIGEEEFNLLQESVETLYTGDDNYMEYSWDESHPPISEADAAAFHITDDAADVLSFEKFDDFDEIMQASYIGTWYDPECNEAMRIFEDGCYLYFPALELYGDQLYEWELIDRSDRGLCPMLEIYTDGRDIPGFAFYICGKRENYFWCNSQGAVFYKQ